MDIERFLETWKDRDGSEAGNSQSFLNDLCDLLEVPRPHDPEEGGTQKEYSFERRVTFHHANGKTSGGRIDLYRRKSFVLEAKQGSEAKARISDPRQYELSTGKEFGPQPIKMARRGTPSWTAAMLKAKGQAYAYARALEVSEGWPPFLIVADIGHVIDVYADFSGAGKNYTPFPDGTSYRIEMEDLRKDDIRARLKSIWLDPLDLDPSKRSAQVTRQIADELAALGKSFQEQGHESEATARFLMRCLFTMFAEDVELIPKDSFTNLLIELREDPEHVAPSLEALWQTMDSGGFSPVLRRELAHFNGFLFKETSALPVNNYQLGLLIRAAQRDWREVEPAIFGTLMERALSAKERHKLGAHFTPRAYVERLVTPTILEPLRGDWLDVQAAAVKLQDDGKTDEAIDLIRDFKRSLCNVRVLDPACGSGNFLYVALEGMKRLEGEVAEALKGLGETQSDAFTVDPSQFFGIEINPWAAQIAELVLWIGYLQWHYRTFGKATPAQPVLKDFHNIECRDALLVLEGEHPRLDDQGKPVTRWDGETMRRHPATGETVPDASARTPVYDYDGAAQASWPKADFIIGNPPFIGNKRMREALGDGYVETLWATYPKMQQSADFVMFWWEKAALLAGKGAVRRFGFITTNSLHQTFNRRVLEPHLNDRKAPVCLLFAIPDHPWVDSQDGASVRIALTVAASGRRDGRLQTLETESREVSESEGHAVTFSEQRGRIFANLQQGADVSAARPMEANLRLAHQGVIPVGEGFRLSAQEAESDFRAEIQSGFLKRYLNGRQLTDGVDPDYIIDLFGLSESEAQQASPRLFQIVYEKVRPQRESVNRKAHRERWWVFGEPRSRMRPALANLQRYIATCRTARHRVFSFLESDILPDTKIVAITLFGGEFLSVLSSKPHLIWSERAGAWLGVGNDSTYNHAACFNSFPFPDCTPAQTERLRDLGERLDAHRKARQAEHPGLTLTLMYNVLERLRQIDASGSGEVLEGRELDIYHKGQIGLLKDLHDQIDAAVAEAYGWPVGLSDEEILERLVALNRERHLDEIGGKVRWLRPDYQNPTGAAVQGGKTADLGLEDVASSELHPWPRELPGQVSIVRAVLSDIGEADTKTLAGKFKGAGEKTLTPILESLVALGQARALGEGRYAG